MIRLTFSFLTALIIWLTASFSCAVFAQPNQLSWPAWVQQLRVEAVQDGIQSNEFDQIFKTIPGPSSRVLHYYNTQPERRLTFLEYRDTRASKARIRKGQHKYKAHKKLVDKIARQYGVDPCVMMAIWGLETDYGDFMGSFPVVQSLATLAYNSRRQDFFRKELLESLHIVQDGEISLKDFKGEWAGASGHPQFLPSSWYKYAVDYDGNGHKNIWTSLPDAFASMANYLASNGWQPNQPWGVEVHLPAHFNRNLLSKEISKSVQQWQQLGVRIPQNSGLNPQLQASIIEVGKGGGGITLMMFNNFRALQTWNNSNYYVSMVGYLADRICYR